jgi:DNA polymerase
MELIECLRLQVEFGADEFLAETPLDRRAPPAAMAAATGEPAASAPMPEPSIPPSQPARASRPASRPAGMPAGPAQAARLAESCDTLEALARAMAGFTGCSLRDTATQLVFADGAADAQTMLIGEAPGGEEDRAGRPFVGPAGQLLDRMFASIGLDRSQLRIANVVPWRPPGNRNPTDAEIAVCLPFLLRQIALVAPRRLVLLGAVAAKALLPEPDRQQGIRRLRGSFREVAIPGMPHKLPALATYHPAYLLRMPAAKADSWLDLLSLRQALGEDAPSDSLTAE